MSTHYTRQDLLNARKAYADAAHKNLVEGYKQQVADHVFHEARLGKVETLLTLPRYSTTAPQPPAQIGELPRPELTLEDKIKAVYSLFPDVDIQKEELDTKIFLILRWSGPAAAPNQQEPRS